jgi:hypothetical protein
VEDPLAADRRTLVIGASAMVGLILIGVVSAQLFARGGCADIVEPRPAEAVRVGVPAEDVVDEHLAPVDGLRAVDILEQAPAPRSRLACRSGRPAGWSSSGTACSRPARR